MGPIGTTLGSKQHICCKPFPWYWSLLLLHSERFGFVGVEIRNLVDCATVVQKIKSDRKTANINTKNLRSFITVKAHCSMTHLKQQKSLGLF